MSVPLYESREGAAKAEGQYIKRKYSLSEPPSFSFKEKGAVG
jgi:hypothetical protein